MIAKILRHIIFCIFVFGATIVNAVEHSTNGLDAAILHLPLNELTIAPLDKITISYDFKPAYEVVACKTRGKGMATIEWTYHAHTYKAIMLPNQAALLKGHIHFPGHWANPHGSLLITNYSKHYPVQASCEVKKLYEPKLLGNVKQPAHR